MHSLLDVGIYWSLALQNDGIEIWLYLVQLSSFAIVSPIPVLGDSGGHCLYVYSF